MLADGPRQTINALTLYSFYLAKSSEKGDWWDVRKYLDSKDMVTNILLCTIVFTVLIFIGSLLLLIVAAICYVPLLCYIQGNLKEYCCHKVDKVNEFLLSCSVSNMFCSELQSSLRESRSNAWPNRHKSPRKRLLETSLT